MEIIATLVLLLVSIIFIFVGVKGIRHKKPNEIDKYFIFYWRFTTDKGLKLGGLLYLLVGIITLGMAIIINI